MDEYLKAAREEVMPGWSPEREDRLLAGVFEAIEGHSSASSPHATGARALAQKSWFFPAASLLVAAAGVVLFLFVGNATKEEDGLVSSTDLSTAVEKQGAGASELSFAPGTRALLGAGAQVRSVEQSAQRISLEQFSGSVHYQVNPQRRQHFQVVARGVLIEVIGTEFEVSVESNAVVVQVERGIVTVHDGSRDVRLARGEQLRIVLSEETHAPTTVPASEQELVQKSEFQEEEEDTPPAAQAKQSVAQEDSNSPPVDVVGDLLREADRARQSGDLAKAEKTLRRLTAEYGSDRRAISILFSLARVQNARAKYAEAARTFAQVRRRTSQGLGEDALAEEAMCLALSGQGKLARARAKEYLSAYPQGLHQGRMKKLLP